MIKTAELFLAKLDFAIKLARYDSLFFIENIPDFTKVMFFARLFEKKNQNSNAENFSKFWRREEYSISHKLVKEIASRVDVIDFETQEKLTDINFAKDEKNPEILYRVKNYKCYLDESKFHEKMMVKELIDISPAIKSLRKFIKSKEFKNSFFYNHIKLYKEIIENSSDLRFEASLLEELDDIYSENISYLGFKVDWLSSSKNKMYLYSGKSINKNNLSDTAQENLVNIILYGLFSKKRFICNIIDNVWVDENDEISFFNIDYIYRIEDAELNYFKNFVKAFNVKDFDKIINLHKNLKLLSSDKKLEKKLIEIISKSYNEKPNSISYMLANIYNYIGFLNKGFSLTLLKLQYLIYLLERICPNINLIEKIETQKIADVKENENYSFDLDMLYYAKDVFNKKDVTAKSILDKKSSFNLNEFKSCKYRKSSVIVWLPILILIYLLIIFSS